MNSTLPSFSFEHFIYAVPVTDSPLIGEHYLLCLKSGKHKSGKHIIREDLIMPLYDLLNRSTAIQYETENGVYYYNEKKLISEETIETPFGKVRKLIFKGGEFVAIPLCIFL